MSPAAGPGAGGSSFDVLVVCTGNVCRSPAAQIVLTTALGAGVAVSSAGTQAVTGAPMAAQMAAAIDVSPSVVARQLTPDLVRRADLVLTMTLAQRSAVVALLPAAVRRTFTLHEFAALATLCTDEGPAPGGSPAERLAWLTVTAPRARSRRTGGTGDDIADPYGRDVAAYRRAADEIRNAVREIATAAGAAPDDEDLRSAG